MKILSSGYSNLFNKIKTKESAYILGFLLGNGNINKEDRITCTVALRDKEVLDFISNQINCIVRIDKRFDKKHKIFPNAKIKIGNKEIVNGLKKHFGGRLKNERHIPIINTKLERYLVQGFFDAKGCITWGKRKDRNRIWQKVTFTSQLKMLEGIQNILLKNNISTKIRPKGKENCYVIEFSAKDTVLKFIDYIYPDEKFIILKRKYEKAKALRLELGEFGKA